MAAPVVESVTSVNNSPLSTSFVLNKPSGTVAGDLLVALVGQGINGGVISAPMGWTAIYATQDNGRSIHRGFWLLAGGSEPSSYTFTSTIPRSWAGGILRISGADTSDPIDASDVTVNASAVSTHTCPAVTTTVADTLILRVFGISNTRTGGYSSTPSGATLAYAHADSPPTACYYKSQAAPGGSGTADYVTVSSVDSIVSTIAIAPAALVGNPWYYFAQQ